MKINQALYLSNSLQYTIVEKNGTLTVRNVIVRSVLESRVQRLRKIFRFYPAIISLVVSINAGIIDSLFSPADHNPL